MPGAEQFVCPSDDMLDLVCFDPVPEHAEGLAQPVVLLGVACSSWRSEKGHLLKPLKEPLEPLGHC